MVGLVKYLSVRENYMDLLFIVLGTFNALDHYFHSPFTFAAKLGFIIVINLALLRTFKYLRITKSFSPIVTMVLGVIWDLKQFMLFYFILCGLLSMIVGVIGIANMKIYDK